MLRARTTSNFAKDERSSAKIADEASHSNPICTEKKKVTTTFRGMCRTLNTRHKRTRNGVHACENSLRPTDSNETEAKRSRGGIESVLRLTVPMLWLGLLPPRHLRFVNCLIISALFVNTFPTKAINSGVCGKVVPCRRLPCCAENYGIGTCVHVAWERWETADVCRTACVRACVLCVLGNQHIVPAMEQQGETPG